MGPGEETPTRIYPLTVRPRRLGSFEYGHGDRTMICNLISRAQLYYVQGSDHIMVSRFNYHLFVSFTAHE